MVEGCARTSRVVAAISTVQLYVHRVLMNLEQSDENPNPLVVRFENPRRQEEWWWRKNYQVWVANRKVFLYPENYIEPELRDDKTPLFRELEDTLLAQDVTEQSILDAYATYLHGFEEVAGLRIAGAYHDRNHDGGDLLHLFGVTASEPPVYYYRNVRNLENADGPVFSSWQKVDLQIPVRQVSPIVYFGRLYVFWLETTTRQLTRFTDGDSTFEGYRHSTRLKYSLLRSTGSWSPAQTIRFVHADGAPATFAVTDELLRESEASKQRNTANVTLTVPWDAYQRDHTAPLEDYFPGGWPWARIYPSIVSPDGTLDDSRIRFKFEPKTRSTSGREPQYEIDLWAGTARLAERAESKLTLAAISRVANGLEITTIDAEGLAFHVATKAAGGVDLTYRKESTGVTTQALTSAYPLADVPASTELQPVSGNEMSYLLEPPQQAYLLEASFEAPDADWGYPLASSDPEFQLWRLGTSVAGEIGRSLATVGLETTLSIGRQRDLTETAAAIINRVSSITPRFSDSPTDPNAPLLTYFREVFCHIPFSIANHLNSQQRFADAQRWYHYLFDPTANEPGVDDTLRPWRYREFRERGIESLRASLTSRAALKAYREDPFNPHAIARLRPGAYQKAIFMKYIDNLLDWGDYLFTQFTMESVNEATMLYVMAADILGPRPRELGSCGELVDERNTYEAIKPLLLPPDATEGSPTDVLIEEMEQFTIATSIIWTEQFILTGQFSTAARTRAQSGRRAAGIAGGIGAPDIDAPADPAGWNRPGTVTWKEQAATSLLQLHGGEPLDGAVAVVRGGRGAPELRVSGDPVDPPEPSIGDRIAGLQGKFEARGPRGLELQDVLRQKSPGFDDVTASNRPPGKRPPEVNVPELARARLVFCIPENAELRAYWDRVEDRLHKIRNCMDIAGVRRRLELFAPEIDPRMLVRMRAAGLSLDDVMNVISGNLPPYRFAYLIDRAKQQAGLVQTFGNQVLVALEKRDEEELTRLRTVHEQNLLKLRSQATQWEIDAAVDTLESLERQRASAEYRRNYYLNLSQTGLSAPERVEQAFTHLASGLATAEAVGSLASAVASLVPNFGAPTAMTFGGREISSSLVGFSQFASAVKDASGFIATSAGLEARNLRRDEDWLHQAALAQQEIEQLTRQITAAEIRRDIATESLRVHERSIEQVQEVFDFLRDRFTNLGRLTWLSAELQKLHRLAFNAALSTARLAEQACAFEHPDHRSNTGLSGDYWGPGNAGLLAGDRLLLDLHRLEQQYIEGHDRKLEIEQSFSLARFDPDALSRLKVENKCTFSIPEWFFDLTYPGHYRRRIKGVRLTIPCVVGPYANIGATLRLVESSIRKDPQLDSRVRVPLRHLPVIAASTGQSDAGVFEFNFRDERYMPFEGAGVDSRWELTLPAAVKAFDYATISDVILRISYTAVEDGDLADDVEEETGILTQLSEQGIARTLSLRQDFPDVWHQLLETGAEVGFEIRDLHIPFFLSGFELDVASIDFLVEKLRSADPVYPTLSYAGASIAEDPAAEPGNDAAGLQRIGRTPAVAVVAKHRIEITDAGSAARTAGSTRLDPAIVKDIYLRVTLKRKKPTP
jgi:hypothetical protein